MHKLIILVLFSVYTLFANSLVNDEKLDILAKEIDTKNNIITALGDVVAYSPSYYITAQKLIYDKEKKTLEFFGDVSILRDNETSFSEYLFLNLQDEIKSTKPVVLIDSNNKMWFSSAKIDSDKQQYNFDSTTFSSCECSDPDWSVIFSSGDFDSKEQWVNMYNTTLYIQDVPVLYTPYFGFSTNKTRHSGLLPPTFGFSDNEGVIYAQPIFYAPAVNYDFEYIPQIRFNRGNGHNLKVRYVDSIYSKLQMEGGVFYDKQSFYEKEKLTNKKHYGWNISYDRSKLISSKDHQDGLKLYLVDMNDIDYVNTQHDDDASHYDEKFLTSYIKYFYNTNNFYSDIEVKKYEDVTLNNYDSILQDRPTVNFHKYYNSIFTDKLIYAFDSNIHRQTRETGIGATSMDLSVPLIYSQNIFDDYLNLSFGEEVNYLYLDYSNNTNFKNGHYATLSHMIELNTNLLKLYDQFSHGIQIGAKYTKPNNFVKKGDLYSINTNNITLEDFPVTTAQEQISLYFDQTFYENNNFSTLLDHKISQSWTYDELSDSYDKDDLEHDLIIYYGDSLVSNRFYYDYNLKKIVESSTMVEYNHSKGFIRLYYNFQKDENNNWKNQEDIVYHLGLKLTKNYALEYKIEHDITNNFDKKQEYIFSIDKKCWAVNFKYIDSIIATDTINNNSKRQNIFYVELNLKEFLNFKQQYKSD